MGADRPFKLRPIDYQSVALHHCGAEVRGIWWELFCNASDSRPIGYVFGDRTATGTELAQLCGASEAAVEVAIEQLVRWGAISQDRAGRIYIPRMVREAQRVKAARENGRHGGNPTLRKDKGNPAWDNPGDNPGVKGGVKGGVPREREGRKEELKIKNPPSFLEPGGTSARETPAQRKRRGWILRVGEAAHRLFPASRLQPIFALSHAEVEAFIRDRTPLPEAARRLLEEADQQLKARQGEILMPIAGGAVGATAAAARSPPQKPPDQRRARAG